MMKIIKKNRYSRVLGFLMVFLFVGAWIQKPLFSQTETELPRLALSFAAGVFNPDQESFRDLYGDIQFPFSVQVDYRLSEELFVFSGFRYLSCEGETKIIGYEHMAEHYALRFSMSSAKLGFFYVFPLKRFFFLLGAGLNYTLYQEKWEGTGISMENKKYGFLAHVGALYDLSRRFSLVSRIEYSSIPTKSGSKLEPRVDLGGFEFSLGILIRIF